MLIFNRTQLKLKTIRGKKLQEKNCMGVVATTPGALAGLTWVS